MSRKFLNVLPSLFPWKFLIEIFDFCEAQVFISEYLYPDSFKLLWSTDGY